MYSLELSYLYLQNNLGGILMGIALSLYIREGNGNLLPSPIYRLHAIPIKIPIYKFEENRVYYVDLQSKWFILPLSCSSLISLIRLVELSLYKFCTFIVKFIYKYLILEWIYNVLFQIYLLHVHCSSIEMQLTHFCVLILHFWTLWKWFILVAFSSPPFGRFPGFFYVDNYLICN